MSSPAQTSTDPFANPEPQVTASPPTSPTTPGFSGSPDGLTPAPSCIPPSHPARTLVLCFDGTGDQFDADNSNVVQFFSMLKKDDRKQQMVYYQAGIGTYTTPQVATPFMAKISKTLDEMIAWNLDAHVIGGYEFLMENYEAGDQICIFGFSRGAYTARALAGMVHKVGLLPAGNHQQVPFAYKMFTRTTALGWAQSTLFKKAFSMDVDIAFLGVWDTVCSVGLVPRRLPFTTSNTSVRTFRHAVSLDERRAKFRANLFNWPRADEAALGTHAGDMPKAGRDADGGGLRGLGDSPGASSDAKTAGEHGQHATPETKRGSSLLSRLSGSSKGPSQRQKQRQMERQFSLQDHQTETDVMEVWFAGCHCDVGGGSVPNATRHSLARIPLRWMIRQCFATGTGIRFHAALLRGAGLDPGTLYPTVLARPAALSAGPLIPAFVGDANTVGTMSEEEEDLADALAPVYDQLALKKAWWGLEVVPMRHRVQQEDGAWRKEVTMNLGRPRVIPNHRNRELLVHRSVKIRMEAVEGYRPRAQFSVEPTWVA